jgi:hypothetical protein
MNTSTSYLSGTGVYGSSTQGTGVIGAYGNGGPQGALGTKDYGVSGYSDSTGVYGQNRTSNNFGELGTGQYGVHGSTSSNIGVKGDSGNGIGVYGYVESDGTGVGGSCSTGSDGTGVWGGHSSSGNYGVLGKQSCGVYGFNPTMNSEGWIATGTGVGVRGKAGGSDGWGVWGTSTGTGYGVRGENSGNGKGVFGFNDSTGCAIYGLSANGLAGAFDGNVVVHGIFTAYTKFFKIDHPQDPENKYLMHSSVESPDMKNIYDGTITLDSNGEATVRLPTYFEALNRDFRYQLTCVGGYAPVYIAEKISGNQFKIAGGKAGLEVSWMVTGIRQDAYAKAHPIVVEQEKPTSEKGLYLNPVEWGQPEEKGIGQALNK